LAIAPREVSREKEERGRSFGGCVVRCVCFTSEGSRRDRWMPVSVCPEDAGVCTDRLQAFKPSAARIDAKKECGRRRPEADWYVRWADRGGSYSQSGWSGSKATHQPEGKEGSMKKRRGRSFLVCRLIPIGTAAVFAFFCLCPPSRGVCVHFRWSDHSREAFGINRA